MVTTCSLTDRMKSPEIDERMLGLAVSKGVSCLISFALLMRAENSDEPGGMARKIHWWNEIESYLYRHSPPESEGNGAEQGGKDRSPKLSLERHNLIMIPSLLFLPMTIQIKQK